VIHTRRPEAWAGLSKPTLTARLPKKRGKTSELPPEETVRRTVAILSEAGRF